MKSVSKQNRIPELQRLFSDVFAFWPALSDALRLALLESAEIRRYETKERVSDNGQGALLIVQHGYLCGYAASPGGREAAIFFIEKGRPYLMPAESRESALRSIRAEKSSEVVFIDGKIWDELNSLSACRFSYEIMKKCAEDILDYIEKPLFMTVKQRVAELIVKLCELEDSDDIIITHNELALRLGTVREVVSRALESLSAGGAVGLGRGSITILDKDKLSKEIER